MLQLSLHFADEKTATFFNRLGWLDIGYEKLDAFSTYKAKMFVVGKGELPTIRIEKYPRWSASVWDLVLRAVAKGLTGEERLNQDLPVGRKGPFIDQLYAKLEHVADGTDGRRSHIGSATVVMKRTRCNYVANVEDDFCGMRPSDVFRHTPAVLNHWELFARGLASALTGKEEVPPRPALSLPSALALEDEKTKFVSLGRLTEPARSGFTRWLAKKGVTPTEHHAAPQGLVPEALFVDFLRTAI